MHIYNKYINNMYTHTYVYIYIYMCVCVEHLNRCKTSNRCLLGFFVNRTIFQAGGSGPLMSPLPTKLLMSWEDIGTDHPVVPAKFYFLVMGRG